MKNSNIASERQNVGRTPQLTKKPWHLVPLNYLKNIIEAGSRKAGERCDIILALIKKFEQVTTNIAHL